MTDEELLADFINFIKKQLHYGSSRTPLMEAMIGDYTGYATEVEKLTAGLEKLDAIKYKGGNAIIDMDKIL